MQRTLKTTGLLDVHRTEPKEWGYAGHWLGTTLMPVY